MAADPFAFPFPFSALLFPKLVIQTPLTTIEVALAPSAAQSYGKHIGPIYRTPADYVTHT